MERLQYIDNERTVVVAGLELGVVVFLSSV